MARVTWSKKAEKGLRGIPATDKERIILSVRELASWPDCRNVKALVGREGYRLRVGCYRVLFSVREGELCIICIEEVKRRDERTY